MRRLVSAGVFVGTVLVVACGSDLAEEAGDMMRGAGEALADAGAALADAGGDAAQAETDGGEADSGSGSGSGSSSAPKGRIIESACDVVRYTQFPNAIFPPIADRWSSVEVPQESIRSVWLCYSADGGACPTGMICTGTQLPEPECKPATNYYYAAGRLWTRCLGATPAAVRVAVD